MISRWINICLKERLHYKHHSGSLLAFWWQTDVAFHLQWMSHLLVIFLRSPCLSLFHYPSIGCLSVSHVRLKLLYTYDCGLKFSFSVWLCIKYLCLCHSFGPVVRGTALDESNIPDQVKQNLKRTHTISNKEFLYIYIKWMIIFFHMLLHFHMWKVANRASLGSLWTMAFFNLHFVKARFVEHITNNCGVSRFVQLSFGSLLLLAAGGSSG